jgi:hypothetical protein
MARKTVRRRLPTLPKASFNSPREHKTARLVEILRGVAISEQGEQPRPFYALREVGRHFRVPLSMVARVYSQLEEEGLLVTLHGSKTLLQGRSSVRHLSVRGFIGIPASVSAFVALQDYRTFLIRLRRELRARGFAVATIFFDSRDIRSGNLFDRINKYGVDTILWHRPDRAIKEVSARLKDTGILIVGVNDTRLSPFHCRYEIHREAAIKNIARDWRSRSGIAIAVIARGPRSAPAKEEMLESLLEEEHFKVIFQNVENDRPDNFLGTISDKKNAGLIMPSWVASLFAFRAPQALMTLATQRRVMFPAGAPNIPFLQAGDTPVDLVTVDWQLLVEQIVGDLISKKAFDRSETVLFSAQARVQVPLAQYAQIL